LPVDGGLVAV